MFFSLFIRGSRWVQIKSNFTVWFYFSSATCSWLFSMCGGICCGNRAGLVWKRYRGEGGVWLYCDFLVISLYTQNQREMAGIADCRVHTLCTYVLVHLHITTHTEKPAGDVALLKSSFLLRNARKLNFRNFRTVSLKTTKNDCRF